MSELDYDKSGKIPLDTFIQISKQMRIDFEQIDIEQLEKYYTRKGLINYDSALRGLYLYNDKRTGDLKWGVWGVPNRESIGKQLQNYQVRKIRKSKLRVSPTNQIPQATMPATPLDHQINIFDASAKLGQSLDIQLQKQRSRQITPSKINQLNYNNISLGSIKQNVKNQDKEGQRRKQQIQNRFASVPSTRVNPAIMPKNIAMSYAYEGNFSPKRNYRIICQVLAQNGVSFEDLEEIKIIFKKAQLRTGKAFIPIQQFREALPQKFPEEFIDKILPLMIDGKNPGQISFGLFLDILSDLMGSASAFKLLGNTSSKMKMVLQRPDKQYFTLPETDIKDRKILAYIQFRLDEKFRNINAAFRAFDKDHDGLLNYNQFKEGLWQIGIRDQNSSGVNFPQFCALSLDSKKQASPGKSRNSPISELTLNNTTDMGILKSEETMSLDQIARKKRKFYGGNVTISKSRDPNNFNKDVQNQMGIVAKFWAGKKGYRLPSDLNSDHRYGSPRAANNKMFDLMSHQFQKDFCTSHMQKMEDLERQSIEKVRDMKISNIKGTKTTTKRAQLTKQRSSSPRQSTPWKLKKYRNIESKIRPPVPSHMVKKQTNDVDKLPQIQGIKLSPS